MHTSLSPARKPAPASPAQGAILANTEWSKPLIASWLTVETEEAAKPAKGGKGRKGE